MSRPDEESLDTDETFRRRERPGGVLAVLEIQIPGFSEDVCEVTPDELDYIAGLLMDAADAFGERRTKPIPVRIVLVPRPDIEPVVVEEEEAEPDTAAEDVAADVEADAAPTEQEQRIAELPTPSVEYDPSLWRCPDCDWTGETEDDRRIHIAEIHRDGGFPCDECDFVSIAEHGLQSHKRAKHGPPPETGEFPCGYGGCDYVGTTQAALHGHTRIHDRPVTLPKSRHQEINERWTAKARDKVKGLTGRFAAAVREDSDA